VYVRSLQSNNTPATTEATYRDWPSIVDVCFENREADIGRFLRRHLRSITPDVIQELTSTLQKAQAPSPVQKVLNTLENGAGRFRQELTKTHSDLATRGISEFAFVIQLPTDTDLKLNTSFLNLLMSANPKYTGWPMFIDSRGSQNPAQRPSVVDGAWQAFLVTFDTGFGLGDDADFWRASPDGSFYHARVIPDDMMQSSGGPAPGAVLDFGLVILRCAEAVLLGVDFAAAMNAVDDSSILYAFRWTKLKGRQLSAWAQRGQRWVPPGLMAYQDEVLSELAVPVGTPKAAIAQYVHAAVAPLFEVFQNTKFDLEVTTSLIDKLHARRA
jgi:hypothetical protein